jgi:uncharacterized iron-regulated membrane protein
MRDLVTLAVLVAILGAVMWWQRRRHADFERDARRSGLIGASSPRQSVLQLARVEVRFLIGIPATLVGLVLLLPLGISLNVSSGERIDLGVRDIDVVLVCVLFAWAMIVASACAVLRSRRHHADELMATMPMSIASRTEAHLLAALSTVVVGAFATAASLVSRRSAASAHRAGR